MPGRRPRVRSSASAATWRDAPQSGPSFLRRDQLERFADERAESIVVDRRQFDANPAGGPDVRRPEEEFRRFLDQRLLHAVGGRQPRGHVSVAVVIVGEHREHAARREERRLAVRELFRRPRNRQAEAPEALHLRAIVLRGRWLRLGAPARGGAHSSTARLAPARALPAHRALVHRLQRLPAGRDRAFLPVGLANAASAAAEPIRMRLSTFDSFARRRRCGRWRSRPRCIAPCATTPHRRSRIRRGSADAPCWRGQHVLDPRRDRLIEQVADWPFEYSPSSTPFLLK